MVCQLAFSQDIGNFLVQSPFHKIHSILLSSKKILTRNLILGGRHGCQGAPHPVFFQWVSQRHLSCYPWREDIVHPGGRRLQSKSRVWPGLWGGASEEAALAQFLAVFRGIVAAWYQWVGWGAGSGEGPSCDGRVRMENWRDVQPIECVCQVDSADVREVGSPSTIGDTGTRGSGAWDRWHVYSAARFSSRLRSSSSFSFSTPHLLQLALQ
jgi:hypothetical protein